MIPNVVCFKWSRPGYRSTFGPETVNTLRRMVARHFHEPHRFLCVTDNAKGLDPQVEVVPMWQDFADVPSPHGGNNPSCYRRLKVFARDIATTLGDRFVCVDLDTVIVRDITPLWMRTEDFVIWGETDPRSFYNGSMFLLTAGARPQVLDTFNPETSPKIAKKAGKFGSDQGHLSYCLGPGEATWTRADGVYSFRVHLRGEPARLPDEARIVMFHGRVDPWTPSAQQYPWIAEHYR